MPTRPTNRGSASSLPALGDLAGRRQRPEIFEHRRLHPAPDLHTRLERKSDRPHQVIDGVSPANSYAGEFHSRHKKRTRHGASVCFCLPWMVSCQATLGERLRELRWKNSAWLATADTIAGWNGLEIRNAGSGRSPVRKRSG